MNISIRPATTTDLPSVLELIKDFAAFQQTPERVTISLEQIIVEMDHFNFLLAVTGEGTITGFATYFFAYYSWSGKALYLDDLYVRPAYRKHTIGQKLLDQLQQIALENNCKKMRWQVSKWNENAIDFYKKIGATVDDTEMNCDLKILSAPSS